MRSRRGPVDDQLCMKAIAKRLVHGCAWLAVRPRLCGLAVTPWLLGRDEAFAKASESVAAVGGYWGLAVREAFYRSTLTRVGRHVHIGYGTVFSKRDAWVGGLSRGVKQRLCCWRLYCWLPPFYLPQQLKVR